MGGGPYNRSFSSALTPVGVARLLAWSKLLWPSAEPCERISTVLRTAYSYGGDVMPVRWTTWRIHVGTIPPGGMTQGSARSKWAGMIRSPEILRRSQAVPLIRTYEMMPAMTPYAMLEKPFVSIWVHESEKNVLVGEGDDEEGQERRDCETAVSKEVRVVKASVAYQSRRRSPS